MPRHRDHLDVSPSQLDLLAVVNIFRDPPRPRSIRFRIKTFGQRSADLVGSNFGLRVFARAFRIRAGEVRIHSVNRVELPVASHVIVVRV